MGKWSREKCPPTVGGHFLRVRFVVHIPANSFVKIPGTANLWRRRTTNESSLNKRSTPKNDMGLGYDLSRLP